jgi:hypothetical protein
VKRIVPVINAVIAISAGIIVLLGYFVSFAGLNGFRFILLEWATLLAGVAVLMGVGNLFSVHLQKIRERKRGAIYSLVLLVFMLMTMLVGVAPALAPLQGVLLNGIMVPVEISLMAVLAVTLIYATVRMLRWNANLQTFLFLITALLILVGTGPWPLVGQMPIIGDLLRPFISQVLASGGARGILIGVALGTLTTGLRILFGTDRPYGGK